MRRPQPEAEPLDARTARRLRNQLTARLTERLGELAPVEDLVHDAIECFLRNRPRGVGDVGRRARRIADRLAVKYETSVQSRRAEVSGRLPGQAGERDIVAPDSFDLLQRRLTRECLLGAFGQLPFDARRFVMMHDVEGLPLKEIAMMLGCSPTSARVHLRRARVRLSEICEASCDREASADGVMLCIPKQPPPSPGRGQTAMRRGVRGKRGRKA